EKGFPTAASNIVDLTGESPIPTIVQFGWVVNQTSREVTNSEQTLRIKSLLLIHGIGENGQGGEPIMKTRLSGFIFLASVGFLLLPIPANAQTTTGAIVGTVTDATGAVVAEVATVTVTNMDTGIAVKTNTDSTGSYVVTSLPVGRYSVMVEAPG